MANCDMPSPFHSAYIGPIPSIVLRDPSDWNVTDIRQLAAQSQNMNPAAKFIPPSSQYPPLIDCLPVEVLCYIFSLGTHEGGNGNFPVVVSHVCRLWREIALSNPLLWTQIRISSTSIISLAMEEGEVVPRALAFARRSAHCLLDIKLDLTQSFFVDRAVSDVYLHLHFHLLMSSAVDLLVDVHDRIRTLDVVTDYKELLFLISYRVVPLGMQHLESWKMSRKPHKLKKLPLDSHHIYDIVEFDASGRRGLSSPDSDSMNKLLPSLRNLQMSEITCTWNTWHVGNLTSLAINRLELNQRPSISSLREVLSHNQNSLERLELYGSLPVQPLLSGVPIPLLRLRYLRLGYWQQEEALVLLPHLDIPGLKSLALCDLRGTVYRESLQKLERPQFFAHLAPRMVIQPDSDSSELLQVLSTTYSAILADLESLELTGVQILSASGLRPRDWLYDMLPERLICPGRFLLSMPFLKTLTMDGSNAAFLHCLNCPISVDISSEGSDSDPLSTSQFIFPVSQLSTLRILYAEYDDLVDFFFNRSELPGGYPVFNALEFNLDAGHVDLFKEECKGRLDIFSFAYNTVCRICVKDF
ncbi:hypothetical protein ID866_6062 [Astraeus odoratus]|nr:hypothetical protein ID866_6062 [Astraeus odoratus]